MARYSISQTPTLSEHKKTTVQCSDDILPRNFYNYLWLNVQQSDSEEMALVQFYSKYEKISPTIFFMMDC